MSAGPRKLDESLKAYRARLSAEKLREEIVLRGRPWWGARWGAYRRGMSPPIAGRGRSLLRKLTGLMAR